MWRVWAWLTVSLALGGCRSSSTSPAPIDPFQGRTTIPAPQTGAIGPYSPAGRVGINPSSSAPRTAGRDPFAPPGGSWTPNVSTPPANMPPNTGAAAAPAAPAPASPDGVLQRFETPAASLAASSPRVPPNPYVPSILQQGAPAVFHVPLGAVQANGSSAVAPRMPAVVPPAVSSNATFTVPASPRAAIRAPHEVPPARFTSVAQTVDILSLPAASGTNASGWRAEQDVSGGNASADSRQSPGTYGYDTQYRWLEGRLERSRGQWKLRYIPVAAGSGEMDRFGGSVVLSGGSLAGLQEGEFVRVEGRLLGEAPAKGEDFSPLYEVRQLRRLGA